MTVNAGFNKNKKTPKAIQIYQKLCIYNIQSQMYKN